MESTVDKGIICPRKVFKHAPSVTRMWLLGIFMQHNFWKDPPQFYTAEFFTVLESKSKSDGESKEWDDAAAEGKRNLNTSIRQTHLLTVFLCRKDYRRERARKGSGRYSLSERYGHSIRFLNYIFRIKHMNHEENVCFHFTAYKLNEL